MKPLSQKQAEAVAIWSLQHIAEDVDLLGRFLALTGIGPAEIRSRTADPEFLGAVLDFVLADERLVVAIAERFGIPLEAPMAARLSLTGGDPEF